jgi:hypothetical protein
MNLFAGLSLIRVVLFYGKSLSVILPVTLYIAAQIPIMAVSDKGTVALSVLAVTTLGNSIFRYYADRATKKRDKKLQQTADNIHELTNSAFGTQLKYNTASLKALVIATRRLAEITHAQGDLDSFKTAESGLRDAELALTNHLIQQAKVDAAETIRKA